MLKIISCAGFGNTGSSVVTDFFSEFSAIKVVGGSSFEFSLLHENDGIRDLEYAIVEGNRLKIDLAIKRFKKLINVLNYHNPSGPNYKDYFNGHFIEYTEDYLKSLGVISWENGWWHRIFEVFPEDRIQNLVKARKFNNILKKSNYGLYETNSWRPSYTGFLTQYYACLSKDEFKNKTRIYLKRLFLELANDDEFLLFDQLFPVNVDTEYLEYFDFAKVILVDRDPRDLYFMNKVFWGSGYIPTENVEIFIDWFKLTRTNVNFHDNILKICFEDMIFDTEKTQKRLCDFVGIDINNHDNPNTYLFVEKSITNTQVYEKVELLDEEYSVILQNDLKKISNELIDYLYSFPILDNSQKNTKKQKLIIEKVYNEVRNKTSFELLIRIQVVCKCCISKIARRLKRIYER